MSVFSSQFFSSFLGTSLALVIWFLVSSAASNPDADNASYPVAFITKPTLDAGNNSDTSRRRELKSEDSLILRLEEGNHSADLRRGWSKSMLQSPQTRVLDRSNHPSAFDWLPAEPEQYPLAMPLTEGTEDKNFGDPTLSADIE